MKKIKEIVKNPAFKIAAILVLIGIIFTNIGNIIYYGAIGAVIVVSGIVIWSFISTIKENKK